MKVSPILMSLGCMAWATSAFVIPHQQTTALVLTSTRLQLNIGEQERQKLTRDSEPEDFFVT
jgi:hypothetical protein